MEQPQPNTQGNVDNRPTNGLAIAALICAFLVPLVGLILGIIAVSQLKKDTSHKGKGLAVAAIIVSSALILLTLLLVVIGMIAYFGVLNPRNLLPDQCAITSGFTCRNFVVSDNILTLDITNNVGQTITVSNFKALVKGEEYNCNSQSQQGIIDGQSFTLTCQNMPGVTESGTKAKLGFQFEYVNEGSTFPHTVTGSLTATIY